MNPALPPALKARSDALLEGVSRGELAARAAAISSAYRAGGTSAAMVADELSVLAYIFSRLPATYAVTAAVFAMIREAAPAFAPRSFLDAGAGPGTASWAAVEVWPELSQVTMTDSNVAFRATAKTLAACSDHAALASAAFLTGDVNALAPTRADLVTASFVLAEILETQIIPVIAQLWAATRDILVLIEPGTPAGFARIRAARGWLIENGAAVLAPCTHANACPMVGPDWCHFSQRLPRSRDHLKVKGASVPFEDERYSYIVAARQTLGTENRARIIAPPKESKAGITLPLCDARGLHHAFVSRRNRDVHALLRKARWGDSILSEE